MLIGYYKEGSELYLSIKALKVRLEYLYEGIIVEGTYKGY
jgi:hypothetical protein